MRFRPPRAGRQHVNPPSAPDGPAPDAQSLAARLAQGHRIPAEEASEIVGQVARVLVGGHARGQVHGDVRPATIGFADDGRAVLVGAPPPRPGESMAYLSPEQIQRQRVGPPTDIYSLGAVFFEMLAGRPPYAGPDPERVGSVVTVPGQIDGIVTAMLAENPGARPQPEEVVAVLESELTAPPKKIVRTPSPRARQARRARVAPAAVGVLMLLLLPGLVLGGWSAVRAGETRGSVGDAEPLAKMLPSSLALAFDLAIERDALRGGGWVPEEFLAVTDESIDAWTAEVRKLDDVGDPGLRRRTERTAAALERLSEFRTAIRSGDQTNISADLATYTNAVNGLFDLTAELPTFEDEGLARQARNLETIGPVSEVLGFERKIMANALRRGRISDRALGELRAAQSSWANHSESIYSDAEPGTRQALDSITTRSFEFGSYSVPSQRVVLRVLNARAVDDVVAQLEDGGDGASADQVWLADAATFVQDLRNVVIDAAQKLADDIAREHADARSRTIAWWTFTGLMLVALGALGVVLLRSRGRFS